MSKLPPEEKRTMLDRKQFIYMHVYSTFLYTEMKCTVMYSFVLVFDLLPMYVLRLTGPQRDLRHLLQVLRETIAQFDVCRSCRYCCARL